MVREIDLDKASNRDQIRVDGKVAAEVVTISGRKVCVWYQDPFYGYEGQDWFSMSESILGQLPTSVTDIYVKTNENDGYFYKRRDIETGTCIDPFDPFFNERPPERQYAAPIAEARDTFVWSGPDNTEW